MVCHQQPFENSELAWTSTTLEVALHKLAGRAEFSRKSLSPPLVQQEREGVRLSESVPGDPAFQAVGKIVDIEAAQTQNRA